MLDVGGMEVLDMDDCVRVVLQFQAAGHVALLHQFILIGQFQLLGHIAFCDIIQLARLETFGKARLEHVLAGDFDVAG